jgi:hypothetical protein
MMRGGIVTGMMVVLVSTRRHLRIAQDDRETSVHGYEHESRRNERPQEQHTEDEQRRPSRLFNVPHPFHCGAVPKLLAHHVLGVGGILAFFGTLCTRFCAIIANAMFLLVLTTLRFAVLTNIADH